MSELGRLLGGNTRSICKGMSCDPSTKLAYAALINGDRESAERRFQRLLTDNPKDPNALAGMAICVAEETGRFVSASKLATQAVRLAPQSPAGYYALGYIHLLGSKLDEGYRYLMKAKHLAPQDPRLAAGFALYDQERPPVISDLSRLHPINRVLGKARYLLEAPRRSLRTVALMLEGLSFSGAKQQI